MKNFLILIYLLLAVTFRTYSQNMFQEKFSGMYLMGNHMVTALSDGSFLFCYELISGGTLDLDIGFTRIDQSGNILATKRISGVSIETGYFPKETSDGNVIMAGRGPGNTILLTKVDFNGNVLWAKSSSLGFMPFSPPVETYDYGFGVVASVQTGTANYDLYLLRTDSAGNFLWGKGYLANNTGSSKFVIVTSDKGFLIAGGVTTSSMEDMLIIKTDSAGNIQWSKQFGTSDMDIPYSATQTLDGGFMISFNSYGGSFRGLNFFKIDSMGTIEWAKNYIGLSVGKYSKITKRNEIVANGTGMGSTVLIKADSLGNLIWNKIYSRLITASNFEIATDSGYVLLSPNQSFDTLTVIKTDVDGNSGCDQSSGQINVVNSVLNENTIVLNVIPGGSVVDYVLTSTGIQMNLELCSATTGLFNEVDIKNLEVYPNPSSDHLNIKYKDARSINYTIYNIFGVNVQHEIVNAEEASILVPFLDNGIYFIKIVVNEKSMIRTFIVQK